MIVEVEQILVGVCSFLRCMIQILRLSRGGYGSLAHVWRLPTSRRCGGPIWQTLVQRCAPVSDLLVSNLFLFRQRYGRNGRDGAESCYAKKSTRFGRQHSHVATG